MKVTFLLRADAKLKPGGDSSKVARYQTELHAKGVQTRVVHGLKDVAADTTDVLHILNLDLPLENLRYAIQGRQHSKKIVLSTIRHPFTGMEEMFNYGDDEYHQRLKSLGLSADKAYLLRERAKLTVRRNAAALRPGLSFVGMQKKLVQAVDLLLPMAPAESHELTTLFEPKVRPVVVPNGFSFLEARERAVSKPEFDLISVGRIEPRKNTLALARAAHAARLKLVVVGGMNLKHTKYISAFNEVVASSPYVTYLGHVQHGGLRSALVRAKTYINPAWFEVVSQADSEAAAAGLNVITTRYSYATDFMTGTTMKFDPKRLTDTEGAHYLRSQVELASPVILKNSTTWQESGEKLFEAYSEVLDA